MSAGGSFLCPPGSNSSEVGVSTLIGYMLVFLGAGIGGSLRHAVNRAFLPFGSSFPWGTMAVNVTGSVAMGLLAGWFMTSPPSAQFRFLTTPVAVQHFRLFLTTGVLGGFTTFSAFSLDFALQWEGG